MVKSEDIAKLVGVSRQAVSAVLNGRGTSAVSAEKRKRILEAAQQLHYQPNCQARNLVRGCSRVIGFVLEEVVSAMRSPIYPRFFDAALQSCTQNGYELSILTAADWDGTKLLKLLNSGRVDGIIGYAGMMTPEFSRELAALKMPIVTFANTTAPPELAADLRIDAEPGIRNLARHLRSQGHERIAYVGQPDIRAARHRRIFAAEGIPLRDELCFCRKIYRNNPGDALICFEECERHWDILRTCSAIVFNNDYFAQGGCAMLRLHGVVPGKDIAVAGHDDLEESAEAVLTTTTAPYDVVGTRCAERLCARLRNPDAALPPPEAIPTELIIRSSTINFEAISKVFGEMI